MENAKPMARAILVAAGESTRMRGAGEARKPLITLEGRSLLEIAATAFEACEFVTSIVIVAHADDVRTIQDLAHSRHALRKVVAVVAGGAERADSVRIGAHAAPDGAREERPFQLLCIHDAARPFVTADEIGATIRAAHAAGAALLATPVRDTLKHSTDGKTADRTVDRAPLWAAQTPQVFERERFAACLERAAADGFSPTDDAALWERYIGPVALVEGASHGAKITGPSDLEWARALAAQLGTQA